jgi:hypothetical protein
LSDPSATKVVFAPDLIGAALVDSDARKVFNLWRDGALTVVTNRELVALHLRCLKNLGLSPTLLSRWALWLSDSTRAVFESDLSFQAISPIGLCESLANATNTPQIVAGRFPDGATSPKWITAGKLVKVK